SYSESLNAVISGTSGLSSGAGSASLVLAGGISNNALTLGLGSGSYSSVGVKSGTVAVAFQTDGAGTSGLSAISAGSQTVQLTGNVYRLASGTLAASSVNLGAIRENQTFNSGSLGVSNTASADTFSDDLAVAVSTADGGLQVSGGTSRLAAGSTAASSLRFVYTGTTAVAGTISSAATVAYTSKGQLGTGLADIAAGSEIVNVSGSIYRLAVGSLTAGGSVNLGSVRVGETFASRALSVTNKAATDGFSDDLSAAISVTGSGFIASGSVNALTAGGTASSSLTIATVAVTGTVFRVAVGTLVSSGSIFASGGTLNLGNIREGGSFGMTSLDVRNVVASGSYSESLNAGISGTGGFGSGNGSAN
ncbi:MAG: hypothetical protein EBR81_17540, partial [Proteobacteria bacterium]|nr:hypothetical protein [Pseudomonadota bacterium]